MVESLLLIRFFRFDHVFGLLIVGGFVEQITRVDGMWLVASACPDNSSMLD